MKVLSPGRVSYPVGLELQHEARQRVLAGGPDELILLEHDPVVTLGSRGGEVNRERLARLQTPVIETDRGGLATWHGPGQLVGYPIVDLARLQMKVPEFVDLLGGVLEAQVRHLGVVGAAYDAAAPGVYVGGRKLAAIGLHLHRSVSTHGFSLNVDNDLSGFEAIVPCGRLGAGVTTLARELGADPGLGPVLSSVERQLGSRLLERLALTPAPPP
jgi:lipoyl(octanoyl) transferase